MVKVVKIPLLPLFCEFSEKIGKKSVKSGKNATFFEKKNYAKKVLKVVKMPLFLKKWQI